MGHHRGEKKNSKDFSRPLTLGTIYEITLREETKKETGVVLPVILTPAPFTDLPHTGQKQGPSVLVNFLFLFYFMS